MSKGRSTLNLPSRLNGRHTGLRTDAQKANPPSPQTQDRQRETSPFHRPLPIAEGRNDLPSGGDEDLQEALRTFP